MYLQRAPAGEGRKICDEVPAIQGESKVLSVLFLRPIFLNKLKCFQKQKTLSVRVTSLLDLQL